MNFKHIRVSAAIVALAYIAIQSFQSYAFAQFAVPASVAEELQQGNHPLHLVRSSLMLFAMFGLLYVRYVICSMAAVSNRFWATLAFICYFVFFMLEVLLRSTELFYTQLYLPRALAANASDLHYIADKLKTFQLIQSALYFPLILSALGSYIILFFMFLPAKQKINRLFRFVMSVDILRSVWRLSGDYFGIQWLQGNLYDQIYLPLVFITFGSLIIWLLKVKDEKLGYQST